MSEVEVYDRFGKKRDWFWVRQTYGNVLMLDAGRGPKFRLVRVDETEGPAALQVRVIHTDHSPVVGQPVANHWPDPHLPDLRDGNIKTLWAPRAVHQETDANGMTGFGLGNGSYIKDLNAGGPHMIWILSPTYPSDGIKGIGMLGGTNHRGLLHLTFVLDETGEGEPEPEPGDEGIDVDILNMLDMIYSETHDLKVTVERLARHLGAGAHVGG